MNLHVRLFAALPVLSSRRLLVMLSLALALVLAIDLGTTFIGLSRPGVVEENLLIVQILSGSSALALVAVKLAQWLVVTTIAALANRARQYLTALTLLGVSIGYGVYLAINNLLVIAAHN